MTLDEFREKTKDFPGNLQIFMGERLTEFTYGLVNSVAIEKISLAEEPDGEVLALESVIVVTED